MKFENATVEEISNLRCKRKKIQQMIEDFWQSDLQVVRVEFNEQEYKSLASAQSSFSKAARSMKVGVFAVSRNGKLFLVKEKI